MPRFTTIPLFAETRERLKEVGRKGESYDRLLNRILDERQKLVVEFEAEGGSTGLAQKGITFQKVQKFERAKR